MRVLDIQGLSLTYRGRTVLNDINWTLEGGERVGLIGPNGAGKTILLRVILGLIAPTRGTVRVRGRAPRYARGTVAYVPQFARFDAGFPIRVRDVVLMGRLAGKRLGARFNATDQDRADRALAQLDLLSLQDRQIGRLSGGELQRVLIARALVQDTDLLLLDEPTASLDSKAGLELYDLLLRSNPSATVILVSHDIGVIHHYVSSIACLNQRLNYHGTSEVTQAMLEEVYGQGIELLEHPHDHRILHSHQDSNDHD